MLRQCSSPTILTRMNPIHQTKPTLIPVPDGKRIEEHFGRVATETNDVSVARMEAPAGWSEPAQEPAFGEYTLMVSGVLRVDLPDGSVDLHAGESLFVPPGMRVRYGNPFDRPCSYWAVCLPAFSPETAHRQDV